MTAPLLQSNERNIILLFGSQALDFNQKAASQLSSTLQENSNFEWICKAITELPDHWDAVSKIIPRIRKFPGAELLGILNEWLRIGKFPEDIFPLPNILLTPLVVVTHLVQYTQFLEIHQPNLSHRPKLSSSFKSSTETLGLCTGLLSAVAVSSSANETQFHNYGAVAIRLAMVIGALVDAGDVEMKRERKWKSFSVSWTSADAGVELDRILKEHPEAYVSVVFEEKRVTVTTLTSSAASLQTKLKGAGLGVADVNLRGNFHCPEHRDDTELLIGFCDSNILFQFPDATELVLPTWSNSADHHVISGKLHRTILQSMLVEQSNWLQTFTALQASTLTSDSLVIFHGRERCVPPSLTRKLGNRLIQLAELDIASAQLPASLLSSSLINSVEHQFPDDAIAVVGISCELPGASDLEGFWDILCAGKSQHSEVPTDRFDFETAWRDMDPKRTWYGNFIENYNTFDHKFFKKSPREMASTDPQHRLMLQAAYQAVEQSGYFNSSSPDKHVGCYIGVGLVDYENNIACYPANAYSATGNLKAFAAGKISHYFGWTGPGLTIDTACSSSAVAVHQACKAIITGECSAALAGGVNIMTSPQWFQNLAGASFLSPTGQCKPFDVNADGYCRSEGVGAVFLKKLSSAIADGDQVLGVIAASAVYQNQNCTAITVPNVASLSDLFGTVTHRAGLEPNQVTVVEAHGTGTPVGDPAEYDSVRKIFGGSIRKDTLSLGSVKGLLGHTESASGIVALIKILLMIMQGAIPPQASFKTINPSINAVSSDNIEITTKLKPWNAHFRAALINNYGASGSNASLVVTQAPRNSAWSEKSPLSQLQAPTILQDARYPFWICGFDEQSLRTYSARFANFLKAQTSSGSRLDLANLSFQVSRQSNRSLPSSLVFGCSSVSDLEEKLVAFAAGTSNLSATSRQQTSRPVILCFGGQISTFIGLSRELFEHVKVLRYYLDQCDTLCHSLGLESIYPDIFEKTPIHDTVRLQVMLFAIQYSCAKSWIDCGVEVAAVVGHSFGELTALCVSGVLSVEDTIKLIAGRARLIRDNWGPEKGSMMAVEADLEDVEKLLFEASKRNPEHPAPTIACYNGPRSFTVAGTVSMIQAVRETMASSSSAMKAKILDVTNAFHSTLVESIMSDLETVGQGLVFKEPKIPLERATQFATSEKPNSRFVADHLRSPVYFNHAVQRLSQRYPSAIWLEAGSNSTITVMASRALSSPSSSHFQAMNMSSSSAFQSLADATMTLWREGLNTVFWPHHAVQTSEYTPILLPPYQFEKSIHWMELKKPQKIVELLPQPQLAEPPKGLWTFLGFQDLEKRTVRFRVNTMAEKYQRYVSSHIIAQTAPICPSTLQLDIAMDALLSLVGGAEKSGLQPELRGMDSHAPMCMDASKFIWLDAEVNDPNRLIWDWKMTSTNAENAVSSPTLHVSGRIILRHTDDISYRNDFARYERLVRRQRCLSLLDGDEAEEAIRGSRNIYKAFSDIVQYKDDVYRGLQKIAGKNDESAGRVLKAHMGETWLDVGLADSFCQVAGIYLNSMSDTADSDMLISDRIDQWTRSPNVAATSMQPKTWEVFAYHHRPTDKECMSDVFVFDPLSGLLVEVILGIHYVKVSRAGMSKLLSRLSPSSKTSEAAAPSVPANLGVVNGLLPPTPTKTPEPVSEPIPRKKNISSRPDISGSVRNLLVNLSGLEHDEIKSDSDLVDLGIDSLMGMELAREVETLFKCTLEMSDLLELTDFQSLVNCIQATLGFGNDDALSENEYDEKRMDETPLLDGATSPYVNGVLTSVNGTQPYTNGVKLPAHSESLPSKVILETFAEAKGATDRFIEENKLANYVNLVLPRSTELCIVHILDGFEQLGCSLRTAKPGQKLERIQYLPRHEQFVEFLYDLLEKARLVDLNGTTITRTAIPPPAKSAEVLLQDLVQNSADHAYDHKLTYLTGSQLADCLTGKADALQILFASAEGRDIVSSMYGKSPINVAWIKQMEHFLRNFILSLPKQEGPIKILEMGAGTGGTTAKLVKLLADLNVPIRYTVSDLSPSLVAAARKRFKEYPFMEYRVVDIEKAPPAELLQSQHLVIATNCVHATHNLVTSTGNIHQILRPDGFLMMLEMTETLPWIDLIFGLLEGWWLFDDGRHHALVPPSIWEKTLQSVGYGHVDWTDGNRPEAAVQRIIIALASGQNYERVPIPPKPVQTPTTDLASRQVVVDAFVQKYTHGFSIPPRPTSSVNPQTLDECVLLTGATGSLGSHLVEYLANLPSVKTVICLNRYNSAECTTRQYEALKTKGIQLDSASLSKLKVFETDTAKPNLGLSDTDFSKLANSVTHIIHNAWPMSITRSINAFESQFRVMQNLIELARVASSRACPQKIGFQFISSIATVGHYPLWKNNALVPEERMTVDSVLPTGYGDAKLVCEKMLDETLHKYPDIFRPMVVRIGQIAGSKNSGFWNPVEHLAFLIKSCQTLKVLPDFEGELSWCPVNDVAATLGELLISNTKPYPIYHIENPSRQPWREMIPMLADEFDVSSKNIIPFREWVSRVRQYPGSADLDNPAAKLIDFLEENFVRMSCGGLILDTANSTEHSKTLRNSGPVGRELVRMYVRAWKEIGFLRE